MTQTFEPAPDARVDAHGAGLQDETGDQSRVDVARRLDRASGCLLDLFEQVACLFVGQRARRRQLDVQPALLDGHQAVEGARDLLDLTDAAFLRSEAEKVAHELVGTNQQLVEHTDLDSRLELRVAQDRTQLRDVMDRGCKVGELFSDLLQTAALLGRLEECLRIRAVDGSYRTGSSSMEKSRSLIASSISRRWSASSSTLPVTFAVATSVSSATSARICWSARCVSASIWRRVSSSRRWRSASVSSLTRWRCESATRRAAVRLSSACPRASPISARCSSSSFRASVRACSAASIDCRICCRRSSISRWIGPNA